MRPRSRASATKYRIARQVSHPNVCRVQDIGVIEGQNFLSMEYVDGEDLASLLRCIGRLPSDEALEFTRRICAGLAPQHERGVLHRNLKPANIMIDGRGHDTEQYISRIRFCRFRTEHRDSYNGTQLRANCGITSRTALRVTAWTSGLADSPRRSASHAAGMFVHRRRPLHVHRRSTTSTGTTSPHVRV